MRLEVGRPVGSGLLYRVKMAKLSPTALPPARLSLSSPSLSRNIDLDILAKVKISCSLSRLVRSESGTLASFVAYCGFRPKCASPGRGRFCLLFSYCNRENCWNDIMYLALELKIFKDLEGKQRHTQGRLIRIR